MVFNICYAKMSIINIMKCKTSKIIDKNIVLELCNVLYGKLPNCTQLTISTGGRDICH